jgi:hypothetical protein
VSSPREAAIQRLRDQIDQLSIQHSESLNVEAFLGLTMEQKSHDERRRTELIELVKQLEIFGEA